MYLSKSDVASILQSSGYEHNSFADNIIVSSEHGYNKSSGKLFGDLINNSNEEPSNILCWR